MQASDEFPRGTYQGQDGIPVGDVVTLVGNVLKGAGYTLQESGRLVTTIDAAKGGAAQPSAFDLWGLQVLGALVLVEDDLLAERVVLAKFEDDGSSYMAIVDWGDGTARTGGDVISDGSGRFSVLGSHRYTRPGEFTITIRIMRGDAALAVASATALVGSKYRRFVARAFERLLGRPMSSDDQLSSAGERESIVRSILGSHDFRARVVTDIYAQMIGRQPDLSELDSGIDLIADGTTSALRAQLASTDEYFQERGSANAVNFAHALYGDVLGRAPQVTEVAKAVRAANDASARLALARRLLRSADARAHIAQVAAQRYANRPVTDQELVAAISASDVSDDDIIARMFNLNT
jgi:hypothetical protein